MRNPATNSGQDDRRMMIIDGFVLVVKHFSLGGV